jgi:hypothetical protein
MPVRRRMFPPRAWTSSSLSMIYSDQPWSNQIPVTQVPMLNGARTTTSRMRCLISVRGRNSPFSPLLNISARICVLSIVFESSDPQGSKARGLAGIALASLISLCSVVAKVGSDVMCDIWRNADGPACLRFARVRAQSLLTSRLASHIEP